MAAPVISAKTTQYEKKLGRSHLPMEKVRGWHPFGPTRGKEA
eukprot:CAMPEP_0184689396 /NCGR_PEP_ID=MMETSP0312-20130426/30632_1 /TAXON_ID=31354 /ORGANISM="Compsopogon coeruleus, Strain SAG 36.94" /LENGTH=41 /DNA_ID= /DNA_START= /DNA_END= /DNA_ORIENTATION=